MNSASFYAPLRKRVEIKLPAEHSDDDLGLSSDEDEVEEYLPGERETDEEDESDMDESDMDEDEGSQSDSTVIGISRPLWYNVAYRQRTPKTSKNKNKNKISSDYVYLVYFET